MGWHVVEEHDEDKWIRLVLAHPDEQSRLVVYWQRGLAAGAHSIEPCKVCGWEQSCKDGCYS